MFKLLSNVFGFIAGKNEKNNTSFVQDLILLRHHKGCFVIGLVVATFMTWLNYHNSHDQFSGPIAKRYIVVICCFVISAANIFYVMRGIFKNPILALMLVGALELALVFGGQYESILSGAFIILINAPVYGKNLAKSLPSAKALIKQLFGTPRSERKTKTPTRKTKATITT